MAVGSARYVEERVMIAKYSCLSVMLVLLASGTIQPSASQAPDGETLRLPFMGDSPPELVSQNEHWLTKSPPVTLAGLKGKVIWLQFNF